MARTPLELPKGDCRFVIRVQTRKYVCDKCETEVTFNSKALPFLGMYLNKTWDCKPKELEKLGKLVNQFHHD